MGAKKKIIVRINSKEKLAEFSERLGTELPSRIKNLYLPSKHWEVKNPPGKLTYKEPEYWEAEWVDMNEWDVEEVKYYAKINVYIEDGYTLDEFMELVDQKVSPKTKSIHYPEVKPGLDRPLRFIADRVDPRYPIYVVSKGRPTTCLTAEYLIKMEVPFRIIIEKSDWEDYKAVFGEDVLLELDLQFKEDYIKYDDLGMTRSTGPGPARNFARYHSKEVLGEKWHWVMDDNMHGFYSLNNNLRTKQVDGGVFTAAEDFVDRYDNIAVSGLNYYMFVPGGRKSTPYVQNTRIYSCLLMNNEAPFEWQGRYNEDTDICLRVMKEGWATAQFSAWVCDKAATQTMAGGNTEAFYAQEGTLAKSKMLENIHPDVAEVVWKFSRWHHYVNYQGYMDMKNRSMEDTIIALKRKPILDKKEDIVAIKEIMKTNFINQVIWDDLCLSIDDKAKRNKVIERLKEFKYLMYPKEILQRLMAKEVLTQDDEEIEMELLDIEKNHNLNIEINWDEHLVSVDQEKKAKIIKEVIRNRMIRHNEFPRYKYNFRRIRLTRDEHDKHMDSKAYVYKKYLGKDIGPIPVTHGDKLRQGIIEKEVKEKFKVNITKGYDTIEAKDDKYKLIITGITEFSDNALFNERVKAKIEECSAKEIVNGTQRGVDVLAVNYARDNSIPCTDFTPDFVANSDLAIKVNNEKMAGYADEALVFCYRNSEDYRQLEEVMREKGKKVTMVYLEDLEANVFDDF